MSSSEHPDPDWNASPRKRPRSSSPDSPRRHKRSTPTAPYNDAYRLLYNDFVHDVTRPDASAYPTSGPERLGAAIWTPGEKDAFFAAIARQGKDNLPAIAAAVSSKTIPEIRHFLLLLQDASFARAGKRDISLADVPAAAEIGLDCERRLDAARDTLAAKQERFEATQEQKRYGEHWLITSELAEDIELAAKGLRASVPVESGDDDDRSGAPDDAPLLREIPEARLLIPESFLSLSRNVFMNPSPDTSYPWSNWRDLASDLAAEPCIYRTAFRDFHTLVLSVTKRIMQTALVQATSRIRAQGWRVKKGVKLFVRSRDVRAAVDLLGVSGNRRDFFRLVPRRCRLRVTDGRYKSRILPWDQVEQLLAAAGTGSTPFDSDTDAEGRDSQAQQAEFKARAVRSGTPLPVARQDSCDDSTDGDEEDEAHSPLDGVDSDIHPALDESLETSDDQLEKDEGSDHDSSEEELEGLEEFDREVSRLEERKLWSIIGEPPPGHQELKRDPVSAHTMRKIMRRRNIPEGDDWRTWTQYRPEWEEMPSHVPVASFLANRKSPSPSGRWEPATDYDTDYGTDNGLSSGVDGKSRKRLPLRTVEELPLRDSRSYAALRGRQSVSLERDWDQETTVDQAEIPAQSIEETNEAPIEGRAVESSSEDPMQMD